MKIFIPKNGSRFTVHGQSGLTLIEVLVATSVLTIGLLGVALMQVMSISGNTTSREMEVATELAQDMLERLKAMDYGDTALAAGNHPTQNDVNNCLAPATFNDPDNNLIDEKGQFNAPNCPDWTVGPRIYTRTWNVVNDSPAQGMKTITLTVSWIDRNRQQLGLPNPQIQILGVKAQ